MAPEMTREREKKDQKMRGNRIVKCPHCGLECKQKRLQQHISAEHEKEGLPSYTA